VFYISEDMTINITRGDSAAISIGASLNGTTYEFKANDVVRFKVFAKKNCDDVVLKKDVRVISPTRTVEVSFDKEDTKIGDVISKPVEYWYEVELNPDTKPQTIIGYDDDGAKVFKLFPEGGVANE
jgi:hypothetical protein